jgi:hypothetical protein
MKNIRISCANLVKLSLDNKIILLQNRSRSGKDKVYTPLGGAIQATNDGKEYLQSMGAQFNRQDLDLRFTMPVEKLSNFEKWFFRYNGREAMVEGAHREAIVEELGGEAGISLEGVNADEMHWSFLYYAEERKKTDRPDSLGQITQRFYEILKLDLPKDVEERIKEDLKKPETCLFSISHENLAKEVTEGGRIRDNCATLIIDPHSNKYRSFEVDGRLITLFAT